MNEKDIKHCGVCLATDKAAKSFTFPETNYIKKKKKKEAAECYSCSYKGCQLGKIVV